MNTSDDQPSASKAESLDDIKSELTHTMSLLTSKGNDMSPTDYLELVACSIGHTVLTAMQQNEALLPPELYRQYCNTPKTQYPEITIVQEDLPTTRWLLSRLYAYFGEHIVFECKHKKVGTMVLCDVLTVLSNILAKRIAAQLHEETSVRDVTTHF